MVSNWVEVRLGEVVSINPDSIDRDWSFPHITYIDISSVGEGAILENPKTIGVHEAPSRAKRLVKEGDTVLSMVRPGRRSMFFVKRPDSDWVVSTGFAVLRPQRKYIEPRYLYACVFDKSFTDFLVKREKGAAYPAVLPEDIASAVIHLPPLPEQRAIASILGSLDDKIELNRQMNRTLEAIAQALFKSWFVDFDPVWAKKEGRQPFGMDADTAALFPDDFEESELGLIPAGWSVTTVGNVVKIFGGGTPSTKDPRNWGGDIAWATPKDLSKLLSPILLDTERHITVHGLSHISSKLLPSGTLLLSSRAPIGYTAISAIPVSINQGFIAMTCDTVVSNIFMLLWTQHNIPIITGRANGTTFPEISKTNFRPIRILVPPQQVMDFFTETVRPFYELITNNLLQIRTLAKIRDTLLPKLLSGELRVPVETEHEFFQEVPIHDA